MLADKAGKRLLMYVPDYVVFDLETTGISCVNDRVIEIAAVKVVNGQVVDEFATLVNPEMPIPFYASQVNGITDDMVKDSPVFETALEEFLKFAGDMVLAGHNIHSFDMKFLYRDAGRFWNRTLSNDYIDTLHMSRICLPQLKNHKLVDLARHYGISPDGAHRALCDCRMNQKILECLGRESRNLETAVKHCPKCGAPLKKRNGKFGEFWGCMGYPACRHTENI